jgi:hypothetical protein
MRGNLAEEAQGIHLVTAFLVLAGKRQCTLGKRVRFLQATSQHLRLPQRETTERLKAGHIRSHGLFHRLCEQRDGIDDAPGQRIRRSQGRCHSGNKERQVRS